MTEASCEKPQDLQSGVKISSGLDSTSGCCVGRIPSWMRLLHAAKNDSHATSFGRFAKGS